MYTRPDGDPKGYSEKQIFTELIRCASQEDDGYGLVYFINNYCYLFDKEEKQWVNFSLWDGETEYDNQVTIALKIKNNKYTVILKARQLGITFIVLCVFLWAMLFNPIAVVLLISRGETESIELLRRLKSIYSYLPEWMRAAEIPVDNKLEFELSNGSTARALSTRKGDSFAATHLLIDEADLVHESNIDLKQILLKAEPTVGRSGALVLLSKSDKRNPDSTFKRIYNAARDGINAYTPAFIPYYIDPLRDEKWYDDQKSNSLAVTGTYDDLWENYPATPEEALAPNSQSKRFPYQALVKCYEKIDPVKFDIDVPGLIIWKMPESGKQYVIAADPAEGLDSSETDNSGIVVMEIEAKEEVATVFGKIPEDTLGHYVSVLSGIYNNAPCLPERNNHGVAMIKWMKDNAPHVKILNGWATERSQKKPGWSTSSVSKVMMYDALSRTIRAAECIIHSSLTYSQLSSVEAATLRAPGKRGVDDLAVCFGLANAAIEFCIASVSIEIISIGA